jgi:fluoride exporter
VGGLARYYLSTAVQYRMGSGFPWGTLLINITGSLILGFIMRYALSTPSVSVELRVLLTTGFCGGYTTFSTFEWETFKLVRDGSWLLALANILASVLAGFVGVLLGVKLVQVLFPRP